MTDPRLTDLTKARKELTTKICDLQWDGKPCDVEKNRLKHVNEMIADGQLYEPNF